jgi:hypothetical protein
VPFVNSKEDHAALRSQIRAIDPYQPVRAAGGWGGAERGKKDDRHSAGKT